MKVLLDENIWPGLSEFLQGHEVSTVSGLGWASFQNGALLALARDQFDVFVTLDRGIEHQHNHKEIGLAIIILRVTSSERSRLIGAVPVLVGALATIEPGEIRTVRG